MLAYTKSKFGNDHIYTASLLEKIGNVLFDQQHYQPSMLSYLNSLRVYAKLDESYHDKNRFGAEQSRILYAIGRTYHDQEKLVDALSCYLKALFMKTSACKVEDVEVIRILCNMERIHHALGDLSKALEINLDIIKKASKMLGGEEECTNHPFVQSQYMTLGNLYVEMAQHDNAMKSFSMGGIGSNAKGRDDIKSIKNALSGTEILCKIRKETKFHAAAA